MKWPLFRRCSYRDGSPKSNPKVFPGPDDGFQFSQKAPETRASRSHAGQMFEILGRKCVKEGPPKRTVPIIRIGVGFIDHTPVTGDPGVFLYDLGLPRVPGIPHSFIHATRDFLYTIPPSTGPGALFFPSPQTSACDLVRAAVAPRSRINRLST